MPFPYSLFLPLGCVAVFAAHCHHRPLLLLCCCFSCLLCCFAVVEESGISKLGRFLKGNNNETNDRTFECWKERPKRTIERVDV